MNGKTSNVTEDIMGFPGLWGHRKGFGGDGWGGVLVQNGKEYGNES